MDMTELEDGSEINDRHVIAEYDGKGRITLGPHFWKWAVGLLVALGIIGPGTVNTITSSIQGIPVNETQMKAIIDESVGGLEQRLEQDEQIMKRDGMLLEEIKEDMDVYSREQRVLSTKVDRIEDDLTEIKGGIDVMTGILREENDGGR